MYGRGVKSIAEQIGRSTKEAQKMVDDFYDSFPNVKKWVTETETFAKEFGYVEDLWGRRRRLPDIQLPPYEVKFKDARLNKSDSNFNPLFGSKGLIQKQKSPVIIKYEDMLSKCRDRDSVNKVIQQAAQESVVIKNNNGFISQAQRQCVNARIQGGAATMSKKAMINVYNDEVLNKLGFRLLLAVHDELIGECPEEHSEEVANRLCEVMKNSALPECTVPFKCDPTIEKSWYYTDYSDNINEKYKKLIDSGVDETSALNTICTENYECTEQQLKEMLNIA